MPIRTLRRLALVPLTLALLAAACGGGDDDGAASSGDYESDLRALVERVSAELDEANAALDEAESLPELLAAITEAAPAVVAVIEDGLDDLEELEPSDAFADDHAAFVASVRRQLELFEELREAAEDEDVDALLELGPQGDSIEAELEGQISAEYRELIAPFFGDDDDTSEEAAAAVVDADDGGEASPAATGEASESQVEEAGEALSGYEAELRRIVVEIEASLEEAGAEFQGAFIAALADVDATDEEAGLEVVLELFNEYLPSVVAIVDEGIGRLEALEPPPAYAEDHAAFVQAARQLADIQREGFSISDDPAELQDALAGLDRLQTEVEETLRSAVSPAFAAIIAPFFGEGEGSAGADAPDGAAPYDIVVIGR